MRNSERNSHGTRLEHIEAWVAEGELERAREALTTLQTDTAAERARSALLAAELGDWDRAMCWADNIEESPLRETTRTALEAALAEERGEVERTEGLDADDEEERFPELHPLSGGTPEHDTLTRFLNLFGGRRDIYARQWHDARRRRSGYRPVREPLTERVASEHLGGRITLGQYLLWPDGTVSYGVLDLDLAPSALAELHATRGDAVSPLAHGALRDYLMRLLAAGRSLGISLQPAESGRRGAHLWLLLGGHRRPARTVRDALSQIVRLAGSPPT